MFTVVKFCRHRAAVYGGAVKVTWADAMHNRKGVGNVMRENSHKPWITYNFGCI